MKIALFGNPNVGKSLIFQQLTGIGVEISNFPGTTVDMLSGRVCFAREQVEIIDLPGIYALDGIDEQEIQVRSFLEVNPPDVLVVVLDATNLERNLYLLLQVAEYQIPVIVSANISDEAEKQGLVIDYPKLADILGVEVIPTVATEGKNIKEIVSSALQDANTITAEVMYDRHIEAGVRSLVKLEGCTRLDALNALEGIGNNQALLTSAATIAEDIEGQHRMTVHQMLAGNRHNAAERIAREVTTEAKRVRPGRSLDQLITRSFPGIPILIAVMTLLLLSVFYIGSFFEELIVGLFNQYLINPFLALGLDPFLEQVGYSLLIAIQAGMGIAFPFVFVFYVLISILEGSGYMTRAAFLADQAMHRIGMHGQALIPMILGFGCNVPALMAIRALSRRERVIASFLVSMVPCSARTVIIAGIVAVFVGVGAAISIYLIVFVLIILTGLVLAKVTPGEQFGMILEMAPMRKPNPGIALRRAWLHMKEFLFIAMPLLMVSSVILGVLQYFGVIAAFQAIFAPFMMAVLGLPDYASTSLIFGILRKEMAFETLAILAGTADLGAVMTSAQLYIFAVVSVLFVPCVSTIAVLYREMGLKITALVCCYTLTLGMVVGAALHLIFSMM